MSNKQRFFYKSQKLLQLLFQYSEYNKILFVIKMLGQWRINIIKLVLAFVNFKKKHNILIFNFNIQKKKKHKNWNLLSIYENLVLFYANILKSQQEIHFRKTLFILY